ncbi:MAG TPA: APC family permease [Solirubrobacteraceae bacterium]|jgi:amino acid transporter|nr:APC family permease [Solirubrobacteraceae bacterium]
MATTVAPAAEPATESVAASPPAATASGAPGLRAGAIGFASNVAIGVASTAPAYSLAATLGLLVAVAGIGTHAPAVLLVSFVPMFCISVAYRALNRVDPDCGTSFAWVTRALGPRLGWTTGFAIFAADVIVMATLSEIAGKYLFILVGWQSAASSTLALALAATGFIALMTWVAYRGVELSARLQQALLGLELLILAVFAVVALVKVYASPTAASIHPSLDWLNPFSLSLGALVDGVLLGVFVYWGWDACVTVNEESQDARRGPGKAAVVSTLILLVTFVLVATAGQATAGPGFLSAHSTDVLGALGARVLGTPWDKLLILVVLTSTAASTQTTIMPTARTMLSMARWGALPASLGRIHPRFATPSVSTLVMGGVSAVWTIALLVANPAQSVLGDSITALGFLIAFYYGLTGLACAVYYRARLRSGLRAIVGFGVVPLAGALLLAGIFVKAFTHYSQHEIGGLLVNYAHPVAGIEVPIVIGIGSLVLGLILALVLRRVFPDYFGRGREVLGPLTLEDTDA